MTNLRNQIAATIRRVDGIHAMGAAALADAIVDELGTDLASEVAITEELLTAAVVALIEAGWEETHEGPHGVGTLTDDDLRNIARTVLSARSAL